MIKKLVDKIVETNAPIVVGLDPMMKYLPKHLADVAFEQYGETLEGAAEAIWQYNKGIIDNIYDIVPAVKPQIAMYEQFGIEGLKAFKKTVDYCHEKGMIVIGDVKRGDIGSTSEAYAVAHLGKVNVALRQLLLLTKILQLLIHILALMVSIHLLRFVMSRTEVYLYLLRHLILQVENSRISLLTEDHYTS